MRGEAGADFGLLGWQLGLRFGSRSTSGPDAQAAELEKIENEGVRELPC